MKSSGKREYINRSLNRSIAYGVKKGTMYSKDILSSNELQMRLDENKDLLLAALPFMDELYNFVKGSDFFVILSDKEGCVLNIIGDDSILSDAYSLKMAPGAFMDEKSIGTNAIGTCLAERMPVQISGDEHFIDAYHRWTCSAAPIIKMGQVVGALDITGYSDAVHSHTLGMVVAAVVAIGKMIENNEYNDKIICDKTHFKTVLDSMDTGIITCNIEGRINMANSTMEDMFGYSEKEIKSIPIGIIIDGWEKIKGILLTGGTFTNEEVSVNARKNKLQFNTSLYPIYSGNSISEITFVFRDVHKVRKLAGRIAASQAIYSFDKIIGQDKNFIQIIEYTKKISDSKSTILIMGESGTGKEVFAQSIHNYSKRKDEPFIAVNCGAIPRNLIESELFGYEEGAFTGARRGGYAGKFEIADGGTVFLDEIGEMPNDMQIKLLRVIEEGVVTRIGSYKQIYVNVRIIAATNKNLSDETMKGNFRKDLFYRLNVLPVFLPPLRERKGDIPLLLDYFLSTISKKLNKRKVSIPEEYIKALVEAPWPGNIRELENLVERIINTESIDGIDENLDKNNKENIAETKEIPLTLASMEKQYILTMLNRYNGNITSCAKALGIGRNTLYRKIKDYSITDIKHGI